MIRLVTLCLLSSISVAASAQEQIPIEVVDVAPVTVAPVAPRPSQPAPVMKPLELRPTLGVKITLALSAVAFIGGSVAIGVFAAQNRFFADNDGRLFAPLAAISVGLWSLIISGLMLLVRNRTNRKRLEQQKRLNRQLFQPEFATESSGLQFRF